ncbi:MAG: amidase [Halieaceae bacterium]
MSPLFRSAFELAKDIKAGRTTSVATLDFFLARVAAINPDLNAVVALDIERARSRAEEADAAAAKGEDWGPLHGVPITIKDAFSTQGLVTVGGMPEHRDNIPASNAAAVQRYVDAGAIIFGKTNVPFASSDLQSFNDVYGVTNNPWDASRTCGGSSGGASAAVAAGLTPLELGSDIGGSIRTPSHFNGVFGHKPSYGLVSAQGHLPPGEQVISEADLSVVGPIGHCMADIEQAFDLLLGARATEAPAWTISLPAASFEDATGLRVAIWADDEFCRVDSDVAQSLTAMGDSLAALGATVDHHARPDIDPMANHQNYVQLLMSALGGDMPEAVQEMAAAAVAEADPTDMSEPMLQMRGIALSHGGWLRENERRLRIQAAWNTFFQDYDALICPCAMVPAFPHDHEPDMHARTLQVNGEQRAYTDILKWAGLTLNTYLPATAVPAGLSSDGLPIGAQVASRYLGDRTTLAVARLLEEHHRAFTPPALAREN